MRAYDLHVRTANSSADPTFHALCATAQELGFAGLAVESSASLTAKPANSDFPLYRRTTLSLPNAARLRMLTEQWRTRTDILVVHCRSKPLGLTAAAAPAVDMVMLRDLTDFPTFDSQVGRALAKANKPVEVCLSGLLQSSGSQRSRLMRSMASAASAIVRAGCPLVLTSGATTSSGLRAPRDLAALAYLASIPEDLAELGVHDVPAGLIEQLEVRNRGTPRTKEGTA
jgi:ribonuclease P/MRP protein subunit RPP1